MYTHTTKGCRIYFGNKKTGFDKESVARAQLSSDQLAHREPFKTVASTIQAQNMVFAEQTHGIDGLLINEEIKATTTQTFTYPADFIITNQSNVGIGIATADCLPIIIFDPINNALAAIHAGWRGSVAGIGHVALTAMQTTYQTDPKAVFVFLGPCIKQCCYAVGPELIAHIHDASAHQHPALQTRNGMHYFDLVEYNLQQLVRAGVSLSSCNRNYNVCTHCDQNFYSYRRDQMTTGRQMTVAALAT